MFRKFSRKLRNQNIFFSDKSLFIFETFVNNYVNNYDFNSTSSTMAKQDRKAKGCIWELGLAIKHKDEATGKNVAICKCKVDRANPDLTCNKKLALPDGSTSTVRHHIRTKHPTQWIQLLTEEKDKAAAASAKQEEANKLLEEMEGDPDEIEEDLTQPQVFFYFQLYFCQVTFCR